MCCIEERSLVGLGPASVRPVLLAVCDSKAELHCCAGARPTLHEVALSLPAGCLAMVVGPVAAGKSSLLQALLGELHCSAGNGARVAGRVAYAAQEPMITHQTLRASFASDMRPVSCGLLLRSEALEQTSRCKRSCRQRGCLCGMLSSGALLHQSNKVALARDSARRKHTNSALPWLTTVSQA